MGGNGQLCDVNLSSQGKSSQVSHVTGLEYFLLLYLLLRNTVCREQASAPWFRRPVPGGHAGGPDPGSGPNCSHGSCCKVRLQDPAEVCDFQTTRRTGLPNPGRPPGPHPGPGSCFTWTWPLRGSGDGSRSRGPAPCRRPQGRACSWKPASARQPAAAVWAVGWLSSKRESLKGRAGV